ncbi:MAG: ABC transporter ATP-binding protein, partial [Pirellulaceae bacterium]
MEPPVFRARGLTKVYRVGQVEVHALRGVDMELCFGEFVVLLGPSGSGKSTLLNILGGLDVPTSGTIEYLDHDLSQATEGQLVQFRRDHVGFVFQFYNLIPSLTALENVRLITDIAAKPIPAEQALAQVGLTDRLHHFPSQLSGGEQQRVAVAPALAHQPPHHQCFLTTPGREKKTAIT